MKLILCFYLLCFIVGCSSQPKDFKDSELPIFDLTKDYPKKELDIHEIADVEYIPLETNDSSLIKMPAKLVVSEKYIITYDFNGPIFFFDRTGKHIRSIDHYGQGPKEHQHIYSLSVDFKREEYDVYNMNKIQVYDFNGEWKRSLKNTKGTYYDYLFDYNEQYLICVNEHHDRDVAHLSKKYPELFTNIPIDKMPYHLINKMTGALIPLPITIEKWMSKTFNARIVQIDKNTSTIASTELYMIPRMLGNSHDFLISELSKDTLYCYKDGCLIPLAVRHPSIHSYEIPIVISPFWHTDNYLFFKPVELRANDDDEYEPYDKAPLLMWNRKSDQIQHITSLYNSDR